MWDTGGTVAFEASGFWIVKAIICCRVVGLIYLDGMMSIMKKAIAKKATSTAVKKTPNFELSKILMTPKKGTVTRVVLMPAVAPRHASAKKIVAAVRTVVAARLLAGSILKKSEPNQKKLAAPARKVAAPARKIAAPAKKVAAPARQVVAPARKVAAPVRQVAAPARKVAAPARKVAAPARKLNALHGLAKMTTFK